MREPSEYRHGVRRTCVLAALRRSRASWRDCPSRPPSRAAPSAVPIPCASGTTVAHKSEVLSHTEPGSVAWGSGATQAALWRTESASAKVRRTPVHTSVTHHTTYTCHTPCNFHLSYTTQRSAVGSGECDPASAAVLAPSRCGTNIGYSAPVSGCARPDGLTAQRRACR